MSSGGTGGNALEVNVEHRGPTAIVSPMGEIAYTEATIFRAAMKRAAEPPVGQRPMRVVVDLSRVDYMNTPGLAVLVEALQNARKAKTRLVLCNVNQKVKSIFQIARLNTVFEMAETLDAALVV